MTAFTEIARVDIRDNVFQAVGREWMLITAGTLDSFNTMTANWGMWGYMWNRDIAVCVVRPQRHTFGFMERGADYTLCFFEPAWKKALEYCGSNSGREADKIAETGLTPFATASGAVAFEQARLVLECRKLYSDDFGAAGFVEPKIVDEMYSAGDFHRFYVGEIQRVLTR